MGAPKAAVLAVTVLACMTYAFAQGGQQPGGGQAGYPNMGPMPPSFAQGGPQPGGGPPGYADMGPMPASFAQGGPQPGGGPPGYPPDMGPMPAWAQGTDPGELFPRHHWGGAPTGAAGAAPGGVNPFIPPPLRKAAIGMPPCRGWCHYQGENNYKFTQEQVIHMVKRLEKYSTCGIAGVSRWNCSTPGGVQRMWHQGLCYCKAYNNGRYPGEPKCVINECGGCAFDFFVRPTPGVPFERVICD